ncbi:hypothetical protein Sfulv_58700 [Streptomyces fulvorobeus]|uniref:Uncharacterized protein n=1 Tax=Streptomyces fulvorobeus TaxID=284028 RepID=A0A7J0CEY9_9ACTN|nr:hypothetical protein Sfulv_58700 [Streptomyces fulvorobeus]
MRSGRLTSLTGAEAEDRIDWPMVSVASTLIRFQTFGDSQLVRSPHTSARCLASRSPSSSSRARREAIRSCGSESMQRIADGSRHVELHPASQSLTHDPFRGLSAGVGSPRSSQ